MIQRLIEKIRHMDILLQRSLRKANSINRKYFGSYLLKNRIKLLNHNNIKTILDVGANTGQFAYYTRKLGYKNSVISFEPLSSAYSLLNQFARHDSKWSTENIAIGDVDGEIELNISANSQSSSILDMMPVHLECAPESEYIGKETVKIHKLDTIIDQYVENLETTFLKIDTQGFEQNVLIGAEESLKRIKGIQIELSMKELYKGELLFNEMINLIAEKGFIISSLEPGFHNKKTGQLLQVDSVFFKE